MEMNEVKVDEQEDNSGNAAVTNDNGDAKMTTDDIDTNSDEKTAIDVYVDKLHELKEQYHRQLIYGRNAALLAGYSVYFGFAMYHHNGGEDWWRLVWITIFGVLLIAWRLLNKTPFGPKWSKFVDTAEESYAQGKRGLVVRWFLYIAMTVFMVVYIIVAVAKNTPENLRSLIGLFAFPVLLFLYSNKKKKINWHTVFWGMALQFIMALLVLKTSWGGEIPQWVGDRLREYTAHGTKGSLFIFGASYQDHRFVFDSMVQAMVLIIDVSVLTYTGAIQFFVNKVGRPLAYCLRVSPAEGINTVSNIFLQMPESFLFVQEYILDMAPSQLFILYAGGLSTVGGVVLVTYMSFGIPAGPVIAASVMSAPASLAAAKLAFPTHKGEVTPKPDEKNGEAPTLIRKPTSLVDAIIMGIHQSIALIVTIVAYLLALIIIMEFCNKTLSWFGDRVGVAEVTLEFLFSYFFYPISYAMGVRADDCLFVGKLLGIRTFSFSLYAFAPLGVVIKNRADLSRYEAENVNNTWTWIDDDIYLKNWNKTLVNGVIEKRSEVIATYALCGSASVTILGFVVGTLGALVPHHRKEVTEHIFRALIVGAVASILTACFAGLLFEENGS